MANEYAVNKADLTSVANAIRERGGTSAQLAFPSGFVTAIQGIKGGADLNFEVVGGTSRPSSPKENTLWVNTDAGVNGWAFGKGDAIPSSPANGMVFILTAETSNYAFNVFKENSLFVYPIEVYQYANGKWSKKTAEIYQAGIWNAFVTFLYNAGDQFTSLTGGWIGVSAGGVTCNTNSNNLELKVTGSSGRAASFYTNNLINFSGFNVLKAEVNVSSNGTEFCVGITAANSNYRPTYTASTSTDKTGQMTISLSLTSVSIGYICLFGDKTDVKIYKVWLE